MENRNFSVSDIDHVFVVAEIGQNHQGDINIAKEMILSAKECGADCVKFQKSCLKEKFTAAALARPYRSLNSWGPTYGSHKQFLEFTIDQYKELQSFANDHNILFTASAMDMKSLQELYDLNVPVLKIGSGDANNFRLLECVAEHSTPAIISTGMQTESTIRRIVEIMKSKKKNNFCLTHCVSSYPTKPIDVQIRMLDFYRECFPEICLGYSGHEEGIFISCAAVLIGAKVIERHFTLDKRQKGTDHSLSLEPSELSKMIEIIRNIENESHNAKLSNDEILKILMQFSPNAKDIESVTLALKSEVNEKKILDCEQSCKMKLGKSLVYKKALKSGTVLHEEDLCVKVSEPFGMPAELIDKFIGRKLCAIIKEDDNLSENHFD